MIIAGIDPGITGAIAVFDEGRDLVETYDMPTLTEVGRVKRQTINAFQVAHMLRLHQVEHVYLEQVNAMPKQGVTSSFNFGRSYGVLEGVIGALSIRVTHTRPGDWKKRAGLLKADKDAARGVAQRLYPSADLALKKHVGRADAILIAHFGEATH